MSVKLDIIITTFPGTIQCVSVCVSECEWRCDSTSDPNCHVWAIEVFLQPPDTTEIKQ